MARWILSCEEQQDRGVDPEELSCGIGPCEHLGVEARARAVDRVATGRAERHRQIPRDVVEQIHPAVDGVRRAAEIVLRQDRARVAEGVDLEAQPLLQPRLQAGIPRIQRVGEDAHGGPAIDALEPLEDGTQEPLITVRPRHVVDPQGDHRLDPGFPNPLGRRQTREMGSDVERIGAVQIRQTVSVPRSGRDEEGSEQEGQEQPSEDRRRGHFEERAWR